MAITFVAATSTFSNIGSTSSFNVAKPAGAVDGDVVIASICFFSSSGSQRTVTLSGWTLIKTAFSSGTDNCQVSVYYRVLSGDSGTSTWNGTLSGSAILITTATSAYRGVQAVGVSGTATAGTTTSFSTATVNNTVANSWRVVCGAYVSSTTNYTISSNETTRRILFAADDTGSSGATQAAIWDSNTTISTGNTSRTVSRSANWSVAASVILLLSPQTGTPATGTWASTLAKVSANVSGEVHDDATVSATIPAVQSLADGYGQPPVASGTLGASLAPVGTSVAAATDVSGTLDTIVPIGVNIVAETRVFGVRVITVEPEDRVIEVESRGVAD